MRLACDQDRDGRGRRHQERRRASSARAAAPGDPGGAARACPRVEPDRVALGQVSFSAMRRDATTLRAARATLRLRRAVAPFPCESTKTIRALRMNSPALLSAVSAQWDSDIVPQLTEYVRIPAKSPHFDPQWKANGHIERVIHLAEAWVKKQRVRGLK